MNAFLAGVGSAFVGFIAVLPLILGARAERTGRLLISFTDLMGRAHARSDQRPEGIGLAEQEAAIIAVAELGSRYSGLLLAPALAGLRSLSRNYKPEELERLASTLPGAVLFLEETYSKRRRAWRVRRTGLIPDTGV